MPTTLRRLLLCGITAFALSGCNLADDSPELGNSDTNNAANNSSNNSSVNNVSLDGGAGDAANVSTVGCRSDDLSVCPAVEGADPSECIESVCIYQCKPGFFDANEDLEQPDGDGCETDCVPSDDPTEICDGLDNDCNGVVDDGFGIGNTCSNGEGTCEANGRIACDNQGEAVCDAIEGTPGDELCDGLDNDCDGEVDEGNPGGGGTCDTGEQGACRNGTEACLGGQIACEPNNQPVDEACGSDNTGDGVDNDCDGEIDEGCGNCPEGAVRDCYTGNSSTQGVGECEAGEQQCLNGDYQACLGETLPATELCDGLDNNCDGTVDDGYGVGNRCLVGIGECAASGSLICSSDGRKTVCDARTLPPTAETCDGLDNDCDGMVDEDYPNLGRSCTEGVGACRDTGTFVCASDGTVDCDAKPGFPTREICGDRIDNDCDGLVDEGCSGSSNCSPACLAFETCCNDGRDWNCYGRPPINAICEPRP